MPISIDTRTRSDGEVERLDLAGYCEDVLPTVLERTGELAGRGLTHLGLRPMALEVAGTAYTLVEEGGRLAVRPGVAPDAFVVELDGEQFSDLVQDLVSATGFLAAGSVTVRGGSILDVVRWEPVLRAAVDGRPVHEPGMVTMVDRDGGPLDLSRSFTPEDDDQEVAHFLAEAGFLHLRGWLDPADMATIAADMDRALPTYRPGDGRSWWATTADGTERCVRMQHFLEHSETTGRVLGAPAFARLAGLTTDGHALGPLRGNVIEALVKPVGVVKGISDVPWHKDCSLGRHSYSCSGMIVGVSVTGSDADTGQLRVVAGSHRANVASSLTSGLDLPEVALPTSPGDLTVHLSCTLHMATAPTTGERKVMYTGLSLPARGPAPRNRAQLSAIRENAHRVVSQAPGHRAPAAGA